MSSVIVVGAVNVDMVVTAARLPGPGETVVGPGVERFGGGKGANAAVAAARVGATVRLLGAVGDDDLGRGALAELTDEGVDVDGVAVLPAVATGAALIVVDAAGENQIAVGAGANGAVEADAVRAGIRGAPRGAIVLVSTEVPAPAVRAAVSTAAQRGLRCVLNPAPVPDEPLDLLDLGPLLTPNAGELAELARRAGLVSADAESAPEPAAAALHGHTGAPVIVTLGGDGVLVTDGGDGSPPRLVPAEPATVRDTTGAGDTFNGVLAARLASGATLDAAVADANRAAGISVGAPGARAGMPRAADL